MTRVTSHPLARQPISCYYYACDWSYFDVVLCSTSSLLATPLHQEVTFSYYTDLTIRTVKSDCSLISSFHSPVSPDPLNARSLLSLRFPKSPPLKNPRSANGLKAEKRPTAGQLVGIDRPAYVWTLDSFDPHEVRRAGVLTCGFCHLERSDRPHPHRGWFCQVPKIAHITLFQSSF